jgi:23S rRNA pseudouridine2605 synthase
VRLGKDRIHVEDKELASAERVYLVLNKAKRATLLRAGAKNCWLEIVLDEGKNRQIRRMLDALGLEVLRLIRVSIGPLHLGDLPKGAYRTLRPEEKLALDRVLRGGC